MPGRNNTTPIGTGRSSSGPIGDGEIGLSSEIHSAAGKRIAQLVSAENLHAALEGNDKNMVGLVNATIRMVDKWLPADKLRILQDFGSLNGVDVNNPDKLNQALATALIATLPKNELRAIIGRKAMDEAKATKAVNSANMNAANQAAKISKQYAINLKKRYDEEDLNVNNTDTLLKTATGSKQPSNAKKNNKMVLEEKDCKITIPGLKKDLEDTLKKLFDDMQLTALANKMKITYRDGVSRKELTRLITNLIMYYCASLLGKSKGLSASRFDPDTVTAIQDTLKLTSKHGVLAGQVGATEETFKLLRKRALEAQRQQKLELEKMKAQDRVVTRNRLQMFQRNQNGTLHLFSIEKNAFSRVKSEKATWRILGRIADSAVNADKRSKKIKELEKEFGITKQDKKGEAKEALNKIQSLAKEFDIDMNAAGITYEKVITEIASKLVAEDASRNKTVSSILKIKDKNQRNTALNDFKKGLGKSYAAKVGKAKDIAQNGAEAEEIIQEYSDKIPVISLSNTGQPSSLTTKAVPVWVVGQGQLNAAAVKAQKELKSAQEAKYGAEVFDSATSIRSLKHTITTRLFQNGLNNAFHNLRPSQYLERTGEGDVIKTLTGKGDADAKLKKAQENAANVQQVNTANVGGMGIVPINQEINDKIQNVLSAKTADLKNQANAYYKKLLDDFTIPAQIVRKTKDSYGDLSEEELKDNTNSLKAYKDHLNKLVIRLYPNGTFKKDVMPVLEVSKTPEYMEELRDLNTDILSNVDSINVVVSQLPKLFAGLQQGGTAFNIESAMAAVATLVSTATELSKAAAQNNYSKHATGSHIRANKHNVSSIITGDARRGTNNKANPELVKVDWSSKKIDVQPIPAFATGGTAKLEKDNSNIASMNRLTSGERNKPLSVGISNGLVNYTKQLMDVSDDGSKTAVKVYSINSGINEKIKIGDTELSLFDAVYGMFTTVVSIESTLQNNNQLLGMIASNTSAININTAQANSESGATPFEFPSYLDAVLAGD